jgi:pimeloyl-ACP methyl ester carboxylesterase
MATFVLIHGASDVGWYWHLTEAELRARGHATVAPDLPCDNDAASLDDYARTVTDAVGGRQELVIVGQSYGAFTATLVASRSAVRLLVLLAGMIPAPGESPGEWWDNTRYREAVEEQARLDGGKTGDDDPLISFYNGVPRPPAEAALRGGGT